MDFLVHEFFLVSVSFSDMVDFVFNSGKQWTGDLGDFCEPDSETLTSDAR